jgi:transcriptional regulator with XRE-family HTH domain
MNHWTQTNTSDFAYSISLDFFTQIEDSMRQSGMSRKGLSQKIGVTPSAVSQILNNPPENPELETLVQYARNLGLKVAVVAYDDNDSNNDRGPIYSGVFEKAWEALGRPRDLSAFGEGARDIPNAALIPDRIETNIVVGEDDSIDTKQAISPQGDCKNVTGALYAQKAA